MVGDIKNRSMLRIPASTQCSSNDPYAVSPDPEKRAKFAKDLRVRLAQEHGWRFEDTPITLGESSVRRAMKAAGFSARLEAARSVDLNQSDRLFKPR